MGRAATFRGTAELKSPQGGGPEGNRRPGISGVRSHRHRLAARPCGWSRAGMPFSGLSALMHLAAQRGIYTGLILKGDKATNLPVLLRADVVIQ